MKKIVTILIIVFVIISAILAYLNQVVLPVKVKAMIVRALEDATQKKVALGSIKINIFKGLVLRDLKITDESHQILTLKEASCGFFILPFKKQIIIPSIKLQSLVLSVRRSKDNSFNILEPFDNRRVLPSSLAKKPDFNIVVSKVVVADARLDFEDNSFDLPFKKSLENVDLVVYLSLPAKIKYKLNCEIPSVSMAKIKSVGMYNFIAKELVLNVRALDFNPGDFAVYYPQYKNYLKSGSFDILAALKLKDGILNTKLNVQAKNFEFSKGKVSVTFNSRINADFQYLVKENKLNYSGQMAVKDTRASGVAVIDKIENIRADVQFNKMGFSSDNLSALILGLPVTGTINLPDYSSPILKAGIVSELDLLNFIPVLKEKFGLKFDAQLEGQGRLFLTYALDFNNQDNSGFKGSLGLSNAKVTLNSSAWVFENIYGKVNFDMDGLNWERLSFGLFNAGYITSGKLKGYKVPEISFQLDGDNLNLVSDLSINGRKLNIDRLKSRYFNSEISLNGDIDFAKPKDIFVSLSTDSNINLRDLKSVIKKPNKALDILKPSGLVRIKADLEGNIADPKACFLQSKLSSNNLSLYNLKTNNIILDYNQENGIGDLINLNMDFYGGTVKSSGKINFNSSNMPYWFELFLQDVLIEKLKDDTGLKDKNISGTVQGQLKLNGFSVDSSKLSGAGKIMIKDGRLWELNLFKGFGALLFTTDFTNVVFHQGYCVFNIKDKYISTDNLVLKSNLVNIIGPVKIGFDTSVDATLDAEVSPDVPLTGTLKDVTTAILGQAGRFGVIRVTGNFKEPKFKFTPAVMDIIKGVKDAFFPRE